MAKTTKKHFELFKQECERWIEIFGLKGWEVNFYHKPLEGFAEAACDCYLTDRRADLYLFPTMKKVDTEKIKMAAFHEVTELLMASLDINAKTRFVNKHEIQEARHSIIRTLENVLYPKYND